MFRGSFLDSRLAYVLLACKLRFPVLEQGQRIPGSTSQLEVINAEVEQALVDCFVEDLLGRSNPFNIGRIDNGKERLSGLLERADVFVRLF